MFQFRVLAPGDLAAIHAIEVEAYLPSLLVSDAAFLRLIALFPDGAVGAFDGRGLCGYAFGLPLVTGTTLDLQIPLDALPAKPDVFYIHDVAVAGRCRGQGVGHALAARLLDVARRGGFPRAELVSVQGSHPFWERFGFRAVREFDYALDAPSRFMVAEL